MRPNYIIRLSVFGISRDTRVTFDEFSTMLRQANGETPIIARRKQGRGLGGRRRRTLEARRKRAAEKKFRPQSPESYNRLGERRTVEDWIRRVSGRTM